MPIACELLRSLPADPAHAAAAAAPAVGAPVLLEEEDLSILRLIAAGRRRIDIADITFNSTTKTDTRRRRLCHVLAADNSEHLAALGTVYGLVTRDHLPCAPSPGPHVDEDDQQVLDLIVAGWNGSRIAARLQCGVGPVLTTIARLAHAFYASNRRQLAAHAVLVDAVTCYAVSPRFPSRPLSALPRFHIAATGTGILLPTTPPELSAQPAHRSPTRSPALPAIPALDPAGSDRNAQKEAAPIPPELATWVSNHIGRHQAWALPNDLAGARTWRMSSPEGIIELRIPRTHVDLQREVTAHRHAISRLDAGLAPRLIGFEPRLRALLTREPRGERVDDNPDRGLHLGESVHEQAGQRLGRLHESRLGAGDRQAQAAANTLRYVDYIDRVLERIDSPVLAGHRAVIRRRLAVLREVLPQLPVAFCHGSFGSGAWRWQRPTRSLALTGFTRSQLLAAVVDFARPSLLWSERPALQDAFARGYGRPLDELERIWLDDFALLAALDDLWHAICLNDAEAHLHLADDVRAAVDRLPSQS